MVTIEILGEHVPLDMFKNAFPLLIYAAHKIPVIWLTWGKKQKVHDCPNYHDML